MRKHQIAITPNVNGHGTHGLYLDGHDISRGVTSVDLHVSGGDMPRVKLEMAGLNDVASMEFETPHVYIPDATREALIALGWAPPREIPMDRREQACEWIQGFMATTDDDRVNVIALLLMAADDALECALNHKRAESDEQPDGTVA